MYNLNDKIKSLVPYEPVESSFRIHLDANESFLPLPSELVTEMEAKLKGLAMNRYPDATAQKLCKAFADFYGVSERCVVAGNGSDELISVIMSAFLEKSQKFATLEPDFSMYGFYGSIYECEQVKINKPDLMIDIDKTIEVCKNEGIKLLVFSNPCNPTSICLKREEVRRLIEGLSSTLLVLDEAYMDFADESLLDEVESYDNLIILRTCSKAFGMAGIRLGFAVASEPLVRVIKAVKSPYNVNSLTQAIGEVVLSHKAVAKEAVAEIIASKEALLKGVKQLAEKYGAWKVIDGETNFVALIMDDAEEYYKYLGEHGISIRYVSGLIRVTCGTQEENAELLRVSEQYFQSRK